MQERTLGQIRGAHRALAVLVALTAGACSGSIDGTPCSNQDDCPAGQYCTPEGVCRPVPDGGVSDGDGSWCPSGVVCGPDNTCCDPGQICEQDQCVAGTPCTDDTDCIDDTYCNEGHCIPWGTGPKGDRNEACTQIPQLGLFSPAEQCSWKAPPAGDAHPSHTNVLGTPVVVDFDFDDDPQTRRPSIVFVSYNYTDGGGEASNCDGGYFGVIRVIDGDSCAQLHSVDMAKVRASSPVAVGDIDLDGRPEIVAARCGGGLVAFTYNATAGAFELLWTSWPDNLYGDSGGWGGPAIHDLDDDGVPEILLWGTVWSNTGQLLDSALGVVAIFAVAADLDNDGKVELTNGDSIWEFQGGVWVETPPAQRNGGGHVAIADFGTFGAAPANDDRAARDGVPEIAVTGGGFVRVQALDGRIVFGPVALPAGGKGGPPTIGDFDNDGRAEVAAAAADSFTVFDPDCNAAPEAATCPSLRTDGILWSQVSQDHSSNATGSSIFDFEGDGAAEAVYADECFTRVYDGATGEVLYSQWRSSCTWHENPIVADVDGDFNSELVVPSNTNCDIDCTTNPNHHKHPTTGATLDPLFKGLRCTAAAKCPGGSCDAGYCRCSGDADCGGGGFVCGPPVAGTPGAGDVCRAAYGGSVGGVLVYRDVLDRWVSSRMIWNQHAYAVTHVNDDGTIPATSAWQRNWADPELNNFRQNVQGDLDPESSPDLTAKKVSHLSCDHENNLTLRVKLCNRGTQPVAPGLPVSFYRGPPSEGQLICTGVSEEQLDPGSCVEVSCVWSGAPSEEGVDVHVVADDDGSGAGSTHECEEGNNTTVLPGVRCSTIG